MNPFEEKPRPLEDGFLSWKDLAPAPYDKREADPYTRVRIILMNGTEFEAVWFSHQFHRHCQNNDLRRELAILRRQEQQQQKQIAALKPLDETVLEHTIGYEQLAVDLTARMAQCEPDEQVKQALDFALLEDFDHLYRYADLLEMDEGVHAEDLVGKYTEIMPARPTIAHHRWPADSVKPPIRNKKAALATKLHVNIITAAEQQTMNYYMNLGSFYPNDRGRKLYTEIGMVEEQHVTHYGSLLDPACSWLESLLMHEYTECYLYYSAYETETCRPVKRIWEQHFAQEIAHLHHAAHLLEVYEGKQWQQVIPDGTFPEVLALGPNIEYIRDVLARTVTLTAKGEGYAPVEQLPADADFFRYQQMVNGKTANVTSHTVIQDCIAENGQDYRFETAENPIPALRCRTKDNTTLGRKA
ncbi:hypothetical protein [uncultured Gemmiger sp.]|uniref:hypothetical protein n=1 Tax=uncultured Gemmiger sp. TaxID=1623490 RepID=UPI0025D1926A|nr:hypothetical protein [uncultured Gemmiger sp.]